MGRKTQPTNQPKYLSPYTYVYLELSKKMNLTSNSEYMSHIYSCDYNGTLFERPPPLERPYPLERPLDNVKLNIDVLIFTPEERPSLLKGHISGAKGVASQEGFHCTLIRYLIRWDIHEGYNVTYRSTFLVFLGVTKSLNHELLADRINVKDLWCHAMVVG